MKPGRTLRRLLVAAGYRAQRAWHYFAMRVISLVRRDDFSPVFVDPSLVRYTVSRDDSTLRTGSRTWHFGTVSDGDWDIDGYPLDDYGFIRRILHKRVKEGLPYEEIEEYRLNIAYIESGGRPDNCCRVAQYAEKWQRIETLYRKIEREGYRSQSELGEKRLFDEVRVQIARDGSLLQEEGIHRLLIAQVLGLERIPVIVTRTHAAWAARDRSGGVPPARALD